MPAVVLVGRGDRLTTPALAERLSALIRGSRLRIVGGAGQMLPLEAPEWVNRKIATFVESLPAPAPSAVAIGPRRRSPAHRVLDWLTALAQRRGGSNDAVT